MNTARFILGLVICAVALAACDSPSATLRPSASLAEVEFTPRSSRTPPGPRTTGGPTPTSVATFVSLPVGWDDAFCNAFGFTVVAQELVIDVERALEEQNLRDARGLARDLRDAAASATSVLTDLPAWEPAADATAEVTALIDLGARAGEEYGTYFNDGTRNALRRARDLRREIQQRTPQANDALAGLADVGIECGSLALVLEEF